MSIENVFDQRHPRLVVLHHHTKLFIWCQQGKNSGKHQFAISSCLSHLVITPIFLDLQIVEFVKYLFYNELKYLLFGMD